MLASLGTMCLLCGLSATQSYAITIAPATSANDLVNAIVGSGISVVSGSATVNGTLSAAGKFSNGNTTGIGINQGIVLTTGSAANIGNSNTSDGTGTANYQTGDANLNSLVPGYSTRDAFGLEFDFTTTGGNLYFNYVFASEEYNEYVNSSFNDVFGFFLDGNNIALIPNTSTAVAINNVNSGKNGAYYHSNDPSDGTPTPFAFEYDGFTSVFTAQALNLAAGTHHIKLAIADSGDYVLDSGVFIQGSSFSDAPTDPSVPDAGSTLGLLGLSLGFLHYLRRK